MPVGDVAQLKSVSKNVSFQKTAWGGPLNHHSSSVYLQSHTPTVFSLC